MVLHQLLF
jgi:T-complex protein 1 subunit gamma